MGTRTRIVIEQKSVQFNRTIMEIEDSSNMSYVFKNEAQRVLFLRWVGTQERTLLPIWEFSVEWPDDNLIVMNRQIVGYGEFFHEGNTLVEVITSGNKEVAQAAAA